MNLLPADAPALQSSRRHLLTVYPLVPEFVVKYLSWLEPRLYWNWIAVL